MSRACRPLLRPPKKSACLALLLAGGLVLTTAPSCTLQEQELRERRAAVSKLAEAIRLRSAAQKAADEKAKEEEAKRVKMEELKERRARAAEVEKRRKEREARDKEKRDVSSGRGCPTLDARALN